jgi:hypothetical protein
MVRALMHRVSSSGTGFQETALRNERTRQQSALVIELLVIFIGEFDQACKWVPAFLCVLIVSVDLHLYLTDID